MKVLVIDDEEDVRFVIQVSLGRVGGMTVIEAQSGEEGLIRARDDRPDVILLDMMMPGMDGAATLRALREDAQTAEIPVVFMTARSRSDELRRLTELGATGMIRKPFDPMTLATELSAVLGV